MLDKPWVHAGAPASRVRVIPISGKGRPIAFVAGCLLAAALLISLSPARSATDDGLDLAKYKGKVVYLDFWASWCGPCKLSFPYMQKMVSYYPRDQFVIITVNLDHSRERADAFLNDVGATVPVVYDPAGAIATKFQVKAMPTSVLIGRDGRVRYVHQGFFQDKTLVYEAHIQNLLNEK